MSNATSTPAPVATVECDKVYLLRDFLKLAGIGRCAYRTARRNGLKVVRAHGRVYVRGADWHRYLDTLAENAA